MVEGRTQAVEGRTEMVEGRTQAVEGRTQVVKVRTQVVEGKTQLNPQGGYSWCMAKRTALARKRRRDKRSYWCQQNSTNASKEDLSFTTSLHGRNGQNPRAYTCGVQKREYAFKSTEERVWKTLDGLRNGLRLHAPVQARG
ncbi:hypothetical protein VC83_09604 [Pseudogymnoascus destructans]|uniref:Uncharacterized protein n=1 Tax=Pseudogymnoascus destructans TaxID=655981 RepID=A0A2P6FGG8_9PEZI|nr:uncharacterized protein VC83_09604 [Pseudogymnoascus destructans]PQM43477.1 hypothetical protein VC83_09604 [Pseudogymnoascus destructans]